MTDLGSGNDIAESVIIQPDGKIVAAGSFLTASYQYALIRYTSDGLLDNSFNDDGIVTTNIPGVTSEQLNIAAWQPDGKLFVPVAACPVERIFYHGKIYWQTAGILRFH